MRSISLIFAAVLAAGCGDDAAPGGDGPAGGPDAAAPDANPSAPTCVIVAPADDTRTAWDTPVMLMATATDPEDGPLTGARVEWTTDLQPAPLGSGTTVTTTLPVGENLVTCLATDSTGLQGTDTITVNSRSPYAQINHPGDGETRSAAMAVPFVGVGRDQEDGALTGAALVWTSDLDGTIGQGEMVSATMSVGVHTITLTVTDAGGNTDSTTHMLTMTP